MERNIRHYLIQDKALPYSMLAVPNKAMLTGKELGDALQVAIDKKSALRESRGEGRLTKKAVADHFRVRPPSVQDWINFGRIGKHHLNELVTFFSDVVDASYWGIDVATLPEARELTASDAVSEGAVYPNSPRIITPVQIPISQVDQFIADLREAAGTGRLTPHRFALLRGLLHEGIESPAGGIENQRLATRGGNGRSRAKRGKTGTG